ncbi:MAG: DNA internalization-related competence protein ComEC/Rec2 [Mycoplasmatales bacterium]
MNKLLELYLKEIIWFIVLIFGIFQITNIINFIILVIGILLIIRNNQAYFKAKQKIFIISLLLITVYLLIYNLHFYAPLMIKENETITLSIQDNLKIAETYLSFDTKLDNKKVNIFYYLGENYTQENINIHYGDIYQVNIKSIEQITNKYNNRSSFDYQKYEKSKKINYTITVSNPQKIKEHKTLVNNLKNYREQLKVKIEQTYPKQAIYINSLVLGEKISDETVKQNITNIGIIQLFTISGMHIMFIITTLEFCLALLKVTNKNIRKLIIVFLPIYGILAGSGISIKRVIEVYYFQSYFVLQDKEVSSLNITLIVLIINLILNPYNLVNIGFVLSYGISIFLILNQEVFRYQQENLKSKIFQNFQVLMFVFPITNSLTNKYNILLPYTLIFYNKLVQAMIIMSFIAIALLSCKIVILVLIINVLYLFCIGLFKLLNICNLLMIIKFKSLAIIGVLIYYYLYFRQLKEYYYYKGTNLKKFYILISFLIILNYSFNVIGKVHIIDVGQGDSILIEYPFSNKVMLIDTGPPEAEAELINYLENKGIKKIDYLILTHNHLDHVGNAKKVLEEFSVQNIIVGSNFNNLEEVEKNNEELLKNINIYPIQGLVKTKLGYFYASEKKYEEENNNSVIYYTRLGKFDYLFMGDAEREEELELVQKYNLDFIDKIKLGHHGSKTSTTEEFLQATTPKEVFISSGKDNRYGHPSQETIDKLVNNNIKYEDTQIDGEIIKYFF